MPSFFLASPSAKKLLTPCSPGASHTATSHLQNVFGMMNNPMKSVTKTLDPMLNRCTAPHRPSARTNTAEIDERRGAITVTEADQKPKFVCRLELLDQIA